VIEHAVPAVRRAERVAHRERVGAVRLEAAMVELATLKSQQNEVWYYRIDWDEEPAPFNDIYGAAHAFDLPFIFGTFGPSLFSSSANSTANRPGRRCRKR
jgi:carboxylesterase type B